MKMEPIVGYIAVSIFTNSETARMNHNGTLENIILFPADPEGPGPAAFFLTGVSLIVILVTLPLSLCLCIKVVTILVVIIIIVINVIMIIISEPRWCKSTSEPSYSDLADSEKGALRSELHHKHQKYPQSTN